MSSVIQPKWILGGLFIFVMLFFVFYIGSFERVFQHSSDAEFNSSPVGILSPCYLVGHKKCIAGRGELRVKDGETFVVYPDNKSNKTKVRGTRQRYAGPFLKATNKKP